MKKQIVIFILFSFVLSIKFAYSWDQDFFEEIEQPIAFSHKLHVENNGLSCEYCHSSARVSAPAGIPPVRTCIGCHSLIKGRSEAQIKEIKKITDYWSEKQPIPWKKIHDLPDFVVFSHKKHLNAGFDCTNCHGDVTQTKNPLPKPLYGEIPLSMGWCVSCHRDDHPVGKDGKIIVTARATRGGKKLDLKPDKAVGVKNGSIDCLACHK